MKKVRVRDLAKEFGTSPNAILRLLQGRGFDIRSISSPVHRHAVEWLRFEFTVDEPLPRPAPSEPLRPPRRRPVAWVTPFDGDYLPRSWRRGHLEDPPLYRPALPAQQRSMRSVAMYGTTDAETQALNLKAIHAGLLGSPYSLSTGQTAYLESTFLFQVAALSIRARRAAQQVAVERRTQLRRIRRSTEIYESNRIENLGPDLPTTDRLLHEHSLHRVGNASVAEAAIARCIQAEPKVREVVGLGAARLLAEIYCTEPERPLTESDIRQLHELILVGDSRRGRYKQYLNSIEGSDHVPHAPTDTPAAMSELATWLATTSLAPLWRAAVAHAWLAHIHPFADGNGRVARLLANLILIRADMQPLIVRASGDKGAYLDALSASDAGGDILPLARVFRDVLTRAIEDIADPGIDEQFEAKLAKRTAHRHERWNMLLTAFLSELAPRLLLHRLNLLLIGDITDGELLRIGSGRPENAWIAQVKATQATRDLLLHVAAPTVRNLQHMATREVTPSIFVSIRNPRPLDARRYFPVGSSTFTYEFTPLVDSGRMLMRRGQSLETLSVSDAADSAAESLTRMHRQLIGQPR